MDKKCINCNFFAEEAFGDSKLDLENGMVCSCVESEHYDEHITPKNSCNKWIELE